MSSVCEIISKNNPCLQVSIAEIYSTSNKNSNEEKKDEGKGFFGGRKKKGYLNSLVIITPYFYESSVNLQKVRGNGDFSCGW